MSYSMGLAQVRDKSKRWRVQKCEYTMANFRLSHEIELNSASAKSKLFGATKRYL